MGEHHHSLDDIFKALLDILNDPKAELARIGAVGH